MKRQRGRAGKFTGRRSDAAGDGNGEGLEDEAQFGGLLLSLWN